MDAAYAFSSFIEQTQFEQLPTDVVELLKNDVLDCLGNMIAGSSDPTVELLRQAMSSLGHAGQAETLVFGDSLSSDAAAMVNATMGFALDFDDMHEPAAIHEGVAITATALALAQELGTVSGKVFLCSLAVGHEIACRLGLYTVRRNPAHIMGGWDYASLLSYFSCAATAAKLMGLSKEQIHNALGIALHQAAGTSISAMEHASTKLLGPGFAARGGILSAKLARAGLTGAKSVFNATEISFAAQYNNGYDSDGLAGELGTRWEVRKLGFKAYPCCRLLHRQIDAALFLKRQYEISPEEVVRIDAEVCGMIMPMSENKSENTAPKSKLEAQFSIPWTVACALYDGRVGIAAFEEEKRSNPAIQAMAERFCGHSNPALKSIADPADFSVTTTRGTFFTRTSDAYGSPENPMSFAELHEKFLDCANYARIPFSKEKLDRIVQFVASLEERPELTELRSLLVPQ